MAIGGLREGLHRLAGQAVLRLPGVLGVAPLPRCGDVAVGLRSGMRGQGNQQRQQPHQLCAPFGESSCCLLFHPGAL